MEIKKLTPELLCDWLGYFDRDAFSDNGEWCGCYCMCYHWNEELNRKRAWNCDESSRELNRDAAIAFIESGRMKGYLAYEGGRVVGWCNSNDKRAYDNVNFDPAKYIPDSGERIQSITCFSVAPEYRGRGVASALLEFIIEDAKECGYELLEAYPFEHNENSAYHGPIALYEKHGFELCFSFEGCRVMRRQL